VHAGHLDIVLPGNATSAVGYFRMNLFHAEVRAELSWANHASVSLRALAPYGVPAALVLEVNYTGGVAPVVTYVAEESRSTRGTLPDYKPNPSATSLLVQGVNTTVQTLLAGGDYAFGVQAISRQPRATVYWMSIANDAPLNTSAATVAATVRAVSAAGLDATVATHRTAWATLYPASFLSVGQGVPLSTALEGFYWIQQYKLASAIRPGGPALDLMGPWFQPSGWLFYWMDLNGQLVIRDD